MDDFLRSLTGQAQRDQVTQGAKDMSALLRLMLDEYVNAGFTEEQAFALVQDWHRNFSAAHLSIVVPRSLGGGQS